MGRSKSELSALASSLFPNCLKFPANNGPGFLGLAVVGSVAFWQSRLAAGYSLVRMTVHECFLSRKRSKGESFMVTNLRFSGPLRRSLYQPGPQNLQPLREN
jgi:hypothetical protein